MAQQTQKVISVFLGLAALTRTSGGLECLALKRLYEGTAVPLLTYGCEVWGPTALRTHAGTPKTADEDPEKDRHHDQYGISHNFL